MTSGRWAQRPGRRGSDGRGVRRRAPGHAAPRRGWALVGGLTVAAATASIALVRGSFGDEDWRVIGTSLGFAIFTAGGAAGVSLRLRGGPRERLLGGVTAALAAAGFLLLLPALWIDDESEELWRAWGCVSLAALACSHASLVTGARRATDSEAVRTLITISIGLGAVDALAGILPISGLVDDVDEGAAEVVGVLVIALLLTTSLPPIMRRTPGAGGARGGPPAVRARRRGTGRRRSHRAAERWGRARTRRVRAAARDGPGRRGAALRTRFLTPS